MSVPGTGWVYQPFEGAKLVLANRSAQQKAQYNTVRLFDATPFCPERGGQLSPVQVAYESYGRLSRKKDNVILVCHALTGDSHVASHPADRQNPGWWESMVGDGKPLDTRRYFVICSNVLGGCSGTTGPSSVNPDTQKPFAALFPEITIGDMVLVQLELLKHLGISKIHTVIGGSMGGMQALYWAAAYPEMVSNAIVIAAPGRIRAQAVAYNEVQRHAIQSDPEWKHGDYYPGEGPSKGLSIARMLGMITYQSEESMERKFGSQRLSGKTAFSRHDWPQVRQYLRYQGDKLVRRFDANSYLCLTRALDLFDLGTIDRDYQSALARIRARTLVIGVSSDILYPPHQQRELALEICSSGGRARYTEIQSTLGHDAFLLEFDQMGTAVREFLRQSTQQE